MKHAGWICDPDYAELEPLNVFHKEMVPSNPPISHRADLMNRHTYFRKTFHLGEPIHKAQLTISGDDYYKIYINGRLVGQGPAQGYYFHYPYNSYEVGHFLQQGENVIAVHIYYNGTLNRSFSSGDYRQGLIAELHDGHTGKLIVQSDSTWKCKRAGEYGQGPVIGYSTQFLENIDARLCDGWRENGYDDSGWSSAAVKTGDDHTLVFQDTPVVDVYVRKPVSCENVGENRYVIDFGTEIAGQFTLEASGNPGDIIEIRCGEELDEDGRSVRYKMRCGITYQEFWTLSGRRDRLETFDFKAFRYAEVIGGTVRVESDSFAAVVRHYPIKDENCMFTSSHERFNRIWAICRNAIQYGTQEQFMDCPTREKGQYLGDNTIITHAHMYLSGDTRLTRKALRDFALSAQAVCPGLLAVAPGSHMQEIADFSLQWPLQLLQYVMQSNDLEFAREMLPIAEGILAHFKHYEREDGLLVNVKDKWNLVDWPDNLRDKYDFQLTLPVGDGCHNVINAFYIGSIDCVERLKHLLFPTSSAKVDHAENERRKNAYRSVFFNSDTSLFVDSEGSQHSSLHANALPLFYDLVPPAAKDAVVRFLKEKRLSCGVYMAYFLLNGLARAGEYDYLFDLLTCEDERSWGNMVREGATTCFEAWGKEQKWNTSLCHPWASSPVPIFIEHILGLKPYAPGWEKIQCTPHIPEELTAFDLTLTVRTGTIRFKLANGELSLEAPNGVEVLGLPL